MNIDLRVLIVGTGSIGRRHLRNLRQLGVMHFALCDTDRERMQPVLDEFVPPAAKPVVFTEYARALTDFAPDVVFVCTPPVFHLPQALAAVEYHAHVFIEKPLSNTLDDVDRLIAAVEQHQRIVQVGYNLRFHPGLQKIKALLADGGIGRPLWAHVEVGQYLPDWRPWQDYRQSYTARRELGGGIILDASHEIDYVRWLFGEVDSLLCMAGQVSDLDVNVEDCATLLLRMKSGTQVDVHLDFVQRKAARTCKVVGSEGTILWNFAERSVVVLTREQEQQFPYDFEPNDMYLAEVQQFLHLTQSPNAVMSNLDDAGRTLRVAVLAHEANQSHRLITI